MQQRASARATSVLIPRREAAALAGWSVPTLDRRERSDPTIPARINVGPGEHGPYAYRRDEWLAYLDRLPRAAARVPSVETSARGAALARVAVEKRQRRADSTEYPGAESRATGEARTANAPTISPLERPEAA